MWTKSVKNFNFSTFSVGLLWGSENGQKANFGPFSRSFPASTVDENFRKYSLLAWEEPLKISKSYEYCSRNDERMKTSLTSSFWWNEAFFAQILSPKNPTRGGFSRSLRENFGCMWHIFLTKFDGGKFEKKIFKSWKCRRKPSEAGQMWKTPRGAVSRALNNGFYSFTEAFSDFFDISNEPF